MTTTTGTTLLDHVRGYAAEVRSHLADLSPEQVDELTDGLEADLAEALADAPGPVATGEVPVGGVGAGGTTPADLARRFGAPRAYAEELRSAAGLGPVPRPLRAPAVRRALRRPTGALHGVVDRTGRAWRDVVAALRGSPVVGPAVRQLEGMAPVWWLLRAWSWWVLLVGLVDAYRWPTVTRFIPSRLGDWLLMAALVVGSVAYGRGRGTGRWWARGLLGAAGAVGALNLLWAVPAFADEIQAARWDGGGAVEYVEVPVPGEPVATVPDDGVYVDGMAVSNLFVYDADGNLLRGVQVFDDRGRAVRTTTDGGFALWQLPGVPEEWRFVPARDVDGRDRWNVYPLLGAPWSAWVEVDGASPGLTEGEEPRLPPPPFARAPALVPGPGVAEDEDGSTAG